MDPPIKRVLIVDDDLDHRQLLTYWFSDLWLHPVTVMEACNGIEAVLLTKEWHPHLILMDSWMPEMNGYEAIRLIRTFEHLQAASVNPLQPIAHRIQIIAITAAVSPADRAYAFAAGCDELIEKPYNLERLYHTITRQMALSNSGFSPL